MIKKFSIFESKNELPEIGDYVIAMYSNKVIPEIGKIENVDHDSSFPYLVMFSRKFDYYNYGLTHNNIVVNIDEIVQWGKDKEELKIFLQANKYNL